MRCVKLQAATVAQTTRDELVGHAMAEERFRNCCFGLLLLLLLIRAWLYPGCRACLILLNRFETVSPQPGSKEGRFAKRVREQ